MFKRNMGKVRRHNAATHSWTMSLNKFADLNSTEFKAMYLKKSEIPRESSSIFSSQGKGDGCPPTSRGKH